jgi:ATP-binding cassette, subfamily G (WHITE), member 2, PDR
LKSLVTCIGELAKSTTAMAASKDSQISQLPDFHSFSSSSAADPKEVSQQDQIVADLARKYTNQSIQANHESPFNAPKGSHLDPNSEKFSSKSWAQAFYNLRYTSGEAPARQAGVAFRNLNVFGRGSPTDFQSTFGNNILKLPALFGRREKKIDILHNLDGLILPGEQLCVLGPPGSGCSTLLKTIAGDTHGFSITPDSELNYNGITPEVMKTKFKGEAIYTAEVDAHFPHLSVGDTLYLAAFARSPRLIPGGVSRQTYAEHLRDVSHAHNYTS